MNLGLRDKVALVTGASSGIGAAVARLLAEEGADVVVGYCRNIADAARTADDVRAAGRRAWCVGMDVGNATAVQEAVDVLRQHVQALDVLVLNAGHNVLTPFTELSVAEWDDVIRVNLSGAFYVLRAVQPLLRTGGAIVTVASVAAHTGASHHAHYAAAKAGIVNLTKSAARAMAPGIRVNCVAPGLTLTPMGAKTLEGLAAGYAEQKLLAARVAMPEEIARTIVFMASPAASFIYGATIDVNGGRDLR